MKELLNNFRKDFTEAVKEIEKKYGFELQLERISYYDFNSIIHK